MSKLPSKRQMVQLNDERTSKKHHYDDIPIEATSSKRVLIPNQLISTALIGTGCILLLLFAISAVLNLISMAFLFFPFYLVASLINKLS